jgi:hypothetical protein
MRERSGRFLKRTPAIRVYVDTSVFGGVFDADFARATKRFFVEVASGRFLLVVSLIVADEIMDAPHLSVQCGEWEERPRRDWDLHAAGGD